MSEPIYKEVFLENRLTITADDYKVVYLKMPLQTLQTLPHAFDNQVIEEIYINVDNSTSNEEILIILPPISNPNIASIPDPALPGYTSADTGFKGSWNMKIYINLVRSTPSEVTAPVRVFGFQNGELYQDFINNATSFILSGVGGFTTNTTAYLHPINNNTWACWISQQPLP